MLRGCTSPMRPAGQQAACQRSPRVSARLARAHHWPARGAATSPTAVSRSLPRSVPFDRIQRRLRRLTQVCVGLNTCGVRSSPRHLSRGGRALERPLRANLGPPPEARISAEGIGQPDQGCGAPPWSLLRVSLEAAARESLLYIAPEDARDVHGSGWVTFWPRSSPAAITKTKITP